ncbi:MAG TPA: class I SAM-dependent methyltransferase [Rubrivivax sp.]|nr:class I SAM-dependent methyltransferase [Rubrivivax sp.]
MHPQISPPSPWVCRWAALIRPGGSVLDVACGSGRHVRWLAQQGFRVTGVDRDAAAIEALQGIAQVHVADLEGGPWPLPGERFDAVVVTHYLWRALWPALRGALADNGVLIYETFADGNQSVGKPSRADFLLRHGELLEAARGLHIVAYEDGFLDAPARFVQRIAAVAATATPAVPARYPLCKAPDAGA